MQMLDDIDIYLLLNKNCVYVLDIFFTSTKIIAKFVFKSYPVKTKM